MLLPEQHKIMYERQMIERQGLLQQKPFVLNDRANWPRVEPRNSLAMPMGQGQPQNAYALNQMQQQGAGMPRHAPYNAGNAAAGVGPSPSKRQRQMAPQQLAQAGMVMMTGSLETAVEDDETFTGDFLDHLTPREISIVRYVQHQEWMEEVFASPYATSQIVPVDLGLGLSGELAKLTEGLLDTPKPENLPLPMMKRDDRSSAPSVLFMMHSETPQLLPGPYQKLAPGQLEEFQKRVEMFEQDGQAELEKMKKEHAQKMADIRRSKTYVNAERRLRDAVWGTKAAFDLSKPGDGPEEEESFHAVSPSSKRQVESIINDIEKTLNVNIRLQKDITCVDKGGLIEELAPLRPPVRESSAINGAGGSNGDAADPAASLQFPDSNGLSGLLDDDDENAMDAENTAAGLLDQYGSGSLVNTPGANLSAPGASQPGSMLNSAAPTPAATTAGLPSGAPIHSTADGSAPQQGELVTSADNAGAEEHDLDMDLDIDISNLPDIPGGEGDDAENKPTDDGDWVMVDDANAASSGAPGAALPLEASSQPSASAPAATTANSISTTDQLLPSSGATKAPVDHPTTDPADQSAGDATSPDIFDASAFSTFDMGDDNTAGDALADFDGGAVVTTPPTASAQQQKPVPVDPSNSTADSGSAPGTGNNATASGGEGAAVGDGVSNVLGEVGVEIGNGGGDMGAAGGEGVMPDDDELGLDLDGSAFGDAFVGMEGGEEGEGEGEGQ